MNDMLYSNKYVTDFVKVGNGDVVVVHDDGARLLL
jgi:hypothetical protein